LAGPLHSEPLHDAGAAPDRLSNPNDADAPAKQVADRALLVGADPEQPGCYLSGPDLIPFPKVGAGDVVLGGAGCLAKSLRSLAPGKV
jgi:hypothetical protein